MVQAKIRGGSPGALFVILLMLLFPLAVYLPTHLLFVRIFRAA
jgi:hypothetical protein